MRRKPKRRAASRLSWTAHHEAAHAVAALRLRPLVDRGNVTIVPDTNAGTLGHADAEEEMGTFTQLPDGKVEATLDPRDVEAEIVELLAGYFGSVRAGCPAGWAKIGASSDSEKAARMLKQIGGKRPTFKKRAEQFVDREWKAIEAVARELLLYKTLDDYEVELIADVGRPEARTELAEYRASVGGQGTAYAKLAAAGRLPRAETTSTKSEAHHAA